MFRLGIFVFILCAVYNIVQSQDATTHKPYEPVEKEGFSFLYDGSTQLMLMLSETRCYIFQLTAAEKNSIHTDAGMRSTEMRVLSEVNDAYFTKVPSVILNPSVIRQCTLANRNSQPEFYLVH